MERNAVLLEFLRHELRLLERHIGVRGAVNEDSGRILRAHVFQRQQRGELFRLAMRIEARQEFLAKYTPAENYRQLMEIYYTAIARRRGKPVEAADPAAAL